jgi:hypothetical protein
MRNLNKKFVVIAAVGALAATMSAAWAQTPDPMDTPNSPVDAVNGNHILRFHDEGNSPETDPSAHLILIKDAPARMPVAMVETTTTVSQTETTPAPAYTPPPAPVAAAPADTTATSNNDMSAPPAAPMRAPKADRN